MDARTQRLLVTWRVLTIALCHVLKEVRVRGQVPHVAEQSLRQHGHHKQGLVPIEHSDVERMPIQSAQPRHDLVLQPQAGVKACIVALVRTVAPDHAHVDIAVRPAGAEGGPE